jgi:hypothetical protein
MSTIILILVILVILFSSILGGILYWKREDLFGTGDEAAVLAVLGDSCSTEKKCESPLVCSDLICANAPVDCEFKWSDWSSCSATACGTEGTQTRSYTINKNGAYGGVACEYNNGYEENKKCSMPYCLESGNPHHEIGGTVAADGGECGKVVMRSHPARQNIPFPWCMSTQEWYPTVEEADLACGCIVAESNR